MGLRGKGTIALRSELWAQQIRHSSPGVLHGDGEPPWMVAGLLGLAEGSGKFGLGSWGVHAHWLAPKEERRQVCSSGCQISHDCLSMPSSLSWTNIPAPVTVCHSAPLDMDHWLLHRDRGDLVLGQSLGVKGRVNVGTYSNSASEAAQIPRQLIHHSSTLRSQESTWALITLQHALP